MELYNKIVSLFELFLGLIVCVFSFLKSPTKVLPKYHPKYKNKLLILGNGPSLNSQMDFIHHNRRNSELICVNGFSRNKEYELLKPELYFLLDPIFFKNDWDTYDLSKSTIKCIKEKTDWNLLLILPRKWKNSKSINQLRNNNNISIGYVKNVPMVGELNFFKKTLFKLELSTPVFQNVLLAAIFFGINRKYDEINLFGSDHSWLNNIFVDTNNMVTLRDNHFDETKTIELVNIDKSPKKLYVFTKQIYIMLREYSILSLYAKYRGVKIINYSHNSHIESFVKKKI